MRPIKLELENFITFAGKHEINFEKLQSDSLFLLMGETGAGKTSIFDAIFFALFGESTNKEREATTLRSNYANPSEETKVVFTFALGNQIYTIERNPLYTRNAKRGDKTVDEKPNATLYLPQGNPMEGVSKVNAEVKSLLGLEPEQFKQLVMIPQNEFRKLISSNSNEREAIFMRLFDTQIYTSIVERIKVENRQISNQVSGKKELRKAMMQRFFSVEEPRLQVQLQDMDVEDARVLGIAQDTRDHLSQEIEILKKQYDGNQTSLRSLEIQKVYCDTLIDLQAKQKTIQESVNTLSQQASAMQQAKQVLEHSTKVFGLVQPYQRLQLETQTLANKQKLLGDLLREQTTLANKQVQLEAQKTAKAEEWNTIPQKQTTLEHVQVSIARWDSYQATLAQQQGLESAWVSAVLKQVQTLKNTTSAYLNAKSSTSKQQSRYDEMVVAYQSNIAGELASELAPGKPCQVCGSLTHPSLAKRDDNAISKADLEQQKQAVAKQQQAEELAANKLEAERSVYNDLQYPQAVVTLKPIDWNLPMEALQANEALLSDYPQQTTLHRWSQAAQVEVTSKLASYQDLQGLDIHALQSEKAALEQAILQLLTEKNTVEDQLQTLLQAISKVQGNIQTLSQEVEDRKQQHTIMQSDLNAALTREQIRLEEVVGMKITQQALESENKRITMYENQVVIQNNLLADSIQSYNDFLTQHPDALSWDKTELTTQVATINTLLQQQQKQLETLNDMGKTLTQTLNEIEAQNVELATLEAQFTQINELALLVDNKKMGFKSYVLSVYFDEILEAANMRFKKMTDHRYTMRRDAINARENANSALNLVVHDAYNEKDRDIKTLSGGESFKAALALALAMGDVVRGNAGGINIDTIFIDEGFGTLDPDSLDSALEVLLDLKESGRMVGVISHVPELKNRISNKIEILKSNVGSRIELHT